MEQRLDIVLQEMAKVYKIREESTVHATLPKFFKVSLLDDDENEISYYGLMDVKSGEILCEPIFTNVLPFSDGIAPVEENGKWGYIDINGEYLIYPYLDNAGVSMNGVVWGKYKDRYCLFSSATGKPITSEFSEITEIRSGWKINENTFATLISCGEKMGIIRNDGTWVLQPEYDTIFTYDNFAILDNMKLIDIVSGKLLFEEPIFHFREESSVALVKVYANVYSYASDRHMLDNRNYIVVKNGEIVAKINRVMNVKLTLGQFLEFKCDDNISDIFNVITSSWLVKNVADFDYIISGKVFFKVGKLIEKKTLFGLKTKKVLACALVDSDGKYLTGYDFRHIYEESMGRIIAVKFNGKKGALNNKGEFIEL